MIIMSAVCGSRSLSAIVAVLSGAAMGWYCPRVGVKAKTLDSLSSVFGQSQHRCQDKTLIVTVRDRLAIVVGSPAHNATDSRL